MPSLPVNQLLSYTRRTRANLRDAVLGLCYPSDCRVCGRPIESWHDGVVCAQCWEAAARDWASRELCVKCGSPLRALATHLQVTVRECGKCREFAFACARAAGTYDNALLENVLWLKRHPHLPPRLRTLLCTAFDQATEFHACETILPVPLHAARQTERSFNQAELIAAALAAHTGLPVNTASLLRVKPTDRHRAGMGVDERAKSLRKAFRVHAPRLIAGRNLLVVDDVMTTGSTAHEIAQTLLAGGARSVKVLTLARAVSVFI
ncbi:MAG: ComF family protein [Acidobacteria bacterium]|nr:ComF family protein [Acidobacteriota bacterium]MBI3426445.1 ComF family protein [Acidobacteriota bacterium]